MTPTPTTPATIAAIDLGSNSFHMIVARTVDDQFQVGEEMSVDQKLLYCDNSKGCIGIAVSHGP